MRDHQFSTARCLALTTTVLTLGLALCAGPAQALEVTTNDTGRVVTLTDTPGNVVTQVEVDHGTDGFGDYVQFFTFGSPISVDQSQFPNCDGDGTSTVRCSRDAGSSTVLEMGGGNDVVRRGSPGPDAIRGGEGNDSLLGGPGDDVVDGGPGDDAIEDPEWVNCTDFAGPLAGQAGADQLIGGPGSDTYDGICRNDFVTLTMNGAADDGAAGEGDNFGGDIEIVKGTGGGLRFVGNDLPQTVNGGDAPANEIAGGGGNDMLYGGVEADTVDGGPGNDVVYGYGGNDTIIGGPGRDDLQGEGGSSISDGAGGSDVIRAQDGERDTIACGSFADQAFVDQIDAIAGGSFRDVCEEVVVAGGGGGGGAGGGGGGGGGGGDGGGSTATVSLAAKKAKLKKGRFALRLTCRGSTPCAGTVSVKRKGRAIGSARFTIRAGKTKAVRIALNRRGRRQMRGRRSLGVVVTLKLKGQRATTARLTVSR